METNKKENNFNKILLLIIVILLLIIIVLILNLFSDTNKNLENNQTNNQVNNQENSEQSKPIPDEIKTLLVTDKEAVSLYESVSWDPCSNQSEYYYKQDKILAKDMPEYLRQALAFLSVTDSQTGGDLTEIGASLEDVEKEYKKLFDKDEEFVFQFIDYDSEIDKKESINYYKLDTGNYIIRVGASNCPTPANKKIVSIEKNITKNEIYIYEKVLFWKYTDDNGFIGNIYSDIIRTKLIASNLEYDYDDSKVLEYADKLDTYKYTFKQDSVGNYNFISVEKVMPE